jgi:hypothetical protein
MKRFRKETCGLPATLPDFAREVFTRLFEPDMIVDSQLESADNFLVVRSSNPVVRTIRRFQSLLVDLLWFF